MKTSEEPRRIQKGETSLNYGQESVWTVGTFAPYTPPARIPNDIEQSILDKIDALQKSVDKLQSTVDGMNGRGRTMQRIHL